MEIRLQKYLAEAGVASRRASEKLILSGKIKVNGQVVKELGVKVDVENDQVEYENKLVKPVEELVYLMLNKPKGYVTTVKNFPKQDSVMMLLPQGLKVHPVGRLDKNSEGLLIFTNDGELTQELTHPKFQHEKIYEVKVKGEITDLEKIKTNFLKGVILGGDKEVGHAKKVKYLQNKIFIITLSEGKKRQIRRMFDTCDLEVIDLRRIDLAGLKLDALPEGRWTYLSEGEINNLKKYGQ